jgi:hypothetical protein
VVAADDVIKFHLRHYRESKKKTHDLLLTHFFSPTSSHPLFTHFSPTTMFKTHILPNNIADLGSGTFGFVKKAQLGNSTVAVKYLYDSREMRAELGKLKRVYGCEHIVMSYGLDWNCHGVLR